MSVLLLAVIMSLWAREVQEEVGTQLSVNADDRKIWASGVQRIEQLEKACKITKDFDDECRFKMNPGKGHVFSTGKDEIQLREKWGFVGPRKTNFVYRGVDYTITHTWGDLRDIRQKIGKGGAPTAKDQRSMQ